MLAEMATGFEKFACCHPEAVSLANFTDARIVPFFVQRWPLWVPVLVDPL